MPVPLCTRFYQKPVLHMRNVSLKFPTLNQKTGECLLAAVVIARATSFLFSKLLLESMTPTNLLAVRFLIAFALLAILFRKKLCGLQWKTILRGMLLGGIFFSVMAAELLALRTAPSSTVSFLENTAIVFVPLLESILLRRLPKLSILLSIALALCGIALLTLGGGETSFSAQPGIFFGLLAAMLYAVAILVTDSLSRRDDPLTLGILQVGFIGVFALIVTCLFGQPHLPQTAVQWEMILMLAVVCSGFGFTLQPVAQRYTTAERTGMFCALSPVTAAILGHLVLKEQFGLSSLLGAILVLAGILLSNRMRTKEAAQSA